MSKTPEKKPEAETKELATIDNETGLVNPDNDVGVILKDDHGGSGLDLIDQGAATIKIDSKRGKLFYNDTPDEMFDSIEMTIVNYRIHFRKFGDAGPVCSSDDGARGYDSELESWKECKSCPFYYDLKNYQGDGQCGLGGVIQAISITEGIEVPIQVNLSKSSVRSFKTYCGWLDRKGKKVGDVTTLLKCRFIKGKFQYWAAEFEMTNDTPLVDVESLK